MFGCKHFLIFFFENVVARIIKNAKQRSYLVYAYYLVKLDAIVQGRDLDTNHGAISSYDSVIRAQSD